MITYPYPRPAAWPGLRLDLLDETLEHIYMLVENNLPGWDQADYRFEEDGCGTAFCLAGWRIEQDKRWIPSNVSWKDWEVADWVGGPGPYAQNRFGLTFQEAWGDPDIGASLGLFAPRATIEDFRRMQKALHEGLDITKPRYW